MGSGATGAELAARAARDRLCEGTPVPQLSALQRWPGPTGGQLCAGGRPASRAGDRCVLWGSFPPLAQNRLLLWAGRPPGGGGGGRLGPGGGPRWRGEPRGHPGSYTHGGGRRRQQRRARESTHVMWDRKELCDCERCLGAGLCPRLCPRAFAAPGPSGRPCRAGLGLPQELLRLICYH